MKKIVAYSTMSQLGFMMAIIGLGYPIIAFFHLVTHAFFKATLFMSVGVVFISRFHYQTLNNWSSRFTLPLASLGVLLSLLAINAAPFLAGFYSKEVILGMSVRARLNEVNLPYYAIALLGGRVITAVYSARLWRGLVMTEMGLKCYMNQHSRMKRTVNSSISINGLVGPFLVMMMGVVCMGSIMA